MVKAIDDADIAIVSNETRLRLVKRITPETNVPFTTTWNFENVLKQDYTGKKYTTETPVITSTSFFYNDVEVSIQDDGLGTLFIVGDGIDSISCGTVDYTTGTVSITSLLVTGFDDNYIKIYALPQNFDVETKTNKVLLLEEEDIAINVVATRE